MNAEPTGFLLFSATDFSCCISERPQRGGLGSPQQEGITPKSQCVLWLHRFSKGHSAVSCSRTQCESGISQTCPPPLTTGPWAAAGAGGALCRAAGGGSSRGCTSEQREGLRAGTLQRVVSGHNPPHNDLKPLFPSKAGGKGRGTEEKGKDKPHYYTKNVARKK